MVNLNVLRSSTTREALKTALAMVLTYWIALQANWDKPMWAGLAVALVSLDTLGLSLNKSALRMLGTLVAGVVALVLVGLFPQDRWLLMAALSLWIGGCTYMMLGSPRAYFWQVCGFVSVIICVGAATSSSGAFATAVLRAQQTGLGVLVYSLVAMLVWPRHSDGQFLAAIAELHDKQLALYRHTVGGLTGSVDVAKTTALLGELTGIHQRVSGLLEASVADSYEIWERRCYWQRYVARGKAVTECLERLALLAPGSTPLSLEKRMPALADFDTVIQQRFRALASRDHAGISETPQTAPALVAERRQLESLSLFDVGNLAVIRRQLTALDSLTRDLLSAEENAWSEQPGMEPVPTANLIHQHWRLDADRVIAGVRVMLSLWAAYLLYIYVEGVPAGATLVTLTGSLAMVLAAAPQVAPLRLVLPVLVTTLLAGVIYLFVMPNLIHFWQLALLLFAVTFGICRALSSPSAQAAKALAFSMFISVCSIQNAQTYSFLAIANIAMAFPIVLLLLALAAYFPTSPRPEQVFRRLLARFLCCAGDSFLQGNSAGYGRHRQRLAHALTTLPVEIATWSGRTPARYWPDGERQALDTLVQRIGALAFFIQTLAQELPVKRREPEALVHWRESVGGALVTLAGSLSGTERVDYRELSIQLHALLDSMEAEVRSEAAQRTQLDSDVVEQWLCRAGLLRGIGQSVVDIAETADKFSWRQWDEPRFY
ncbi:FUSC family protein [Microbulbifer sp. Q7]|uniref:FUSC family protein n=1 Tax=Microbulbifer sp. Q7 TaxID=1785091 RepID=UPI00082B45D3|nr:FUSC family protein [Microbulbifer sp. Q7]